METNVPLVEVVYISAARRPFAAPELRDLLARAREKNRSLGITGMLLHADGSFLQVLEGEPSTIEALYQQIAGDTRHHKVLRVFRTETTVRSFGEWTMGFVEPDAALRVTLAGFSDFLHGVKSGFGAQGPSREVSGKVRDLALQFRAGRWRQHVETGEARAPNATRRAAGF